jgi:hypothetical protein
MQKKAAYFLLSAFVVLLPLLVVSVILALRFNKSLFDHAPFYSDELYHWHQSRSFAEVGLNNGYYSFNENTPMASFSHYYAWGVWPYFYYGILGRLFGFGLNALALVNSLSFMAATGFFIWSVRPSWGRLLCLGAVLASFIPLLLYLPSSLLEPLSMSLAMIFAAGFYHLLNRPVTQRFLWGMAFFSVLAGLIRPTFALYLLPLFVLAEEKRDFKTIIFAGLKSVPLILLSAFGFYLTAAPFPHFRSILFLGDEPLGVKLANFAAYIQQSFIWLFTIEGMDSVVIIQRAQIALLLLLLAGWGLWKWRSERGVLSLRAAERGGAWRWELAQHFYNLLGFYLATIFFHETYGGHDYRVMAVHLLFSLVLLAVMRGQWVAAILVLSALLVREPVWDYFGWKDANFGGYVQAQVEEWQPRLDDFLVYDADAPSPWCNTLLSSGFYLQNAEAQPGLLLSVDAGFGLSWSGDWSFAGFEIVIPERFLIPSHFQARYLLLTDSDYEAWGQSLHLQRLMDAPSGALYLNQDAECGG